VALEKHAALDYSPRLMALFQLPDYFLKRDSRFQWREPLYRLKAERGSLNGKSSGRLVLAGSSFCNRLAGTPYHLGEMLREVTGRELLSYCIEGGGTLGALKKITGEKLPLRPGDVFVWELMLPESFAPGQIPVPPVERYGVAHAKPLR
jgi:hypothetical protein